MNASDDQAVTRLQAFADCDEVSLASPEDHILRNDLAILDFY